MVNVGLVIPINVPRAEWGIHHGLLAAVLVVEENSEDRWILHSLDCTAVGISLVIDDDIVKVRCCM